MGYNRNMVGTGTKTILVIEDNAVEREGLTTVLRGNGHAVVAVEDAGEAVDRMQEGTEPDLILLDMLLPRRDGWWFLRQRKRNPDLARIPFVITTALAVASEEWAAALGALGLLRKPIDVDSLLALVERA
jgi:CheY-like chemotaxis protein